MSCDKDILEKLENLESLIILKNAELKELNLVIESLKNLYDSEAKRFNNLFFKKEDIINLFT